MISSHVLKQCAADGCNLDGVCCLAVVAPHENRLA